MMIDLNEKIYKLFLILINDKNYSQGIFCVNKIIETIFIL